MIIEFSITNFGSIREKQTLSMEATKDNTLAQYYTFEALPKLRLLKLAMIFGPNASGKSTVLNALEFLRNLVIQPAQNNADTLPYEPFLLDNFSNNAPSHFELLFVQEGIKYRYNVEFNQKSILAETLDYFPNGREANFFKRTTNTNNQTVEIVYGSKVEEKNKKNILKLETATLWNNTVLGTFAKANIDFQELKKVSNWFITYFLSMITPKTDLLGWVAQEIESSENIKNEVDNLLKYADVQIENITISKEEIEIYNHKKEIKTINMHHIGKDEQGKKIQVPFKLWQESQGTLRYFGLGGVLANLIAESKGATIDEFESSLHPDLAKNFILRYLVQSEKSQLLVTTHNIDFLGEQDIIRRDTVWFTQKNENGATELYSAADFDTSVLRKSTSLLNVYETGKLGAKPNLGSVFS